MGLKLTGIYVFAKKLYSRIFSIIIRTAEDVVATVRREKRKMLDKCHTFFSSLAVFPFTCQSDKANTI
jgi:hypothetical protein